MFENGVAKYAQVKAAVTFAALILTKSIEWGTPEHHQHCEQYVCRVIEILFDILKKMSVINSVRNRL
jgi:hypothetical protein